MSVLKKGDLVTVALRAGGLVRTAVFSNTPFISFEAVAGGDPITGRSFTANDDDRGEHLFVDEGITWVRGHVEDDSPEGKALIAANALAPKTDVFAATYFLTAGALVGTVRTLSPPPTLNPNPKNELGE